MFWDAINDPSAFHEGVKLPNPEKKVSFYNNLNPTKKNYVKQSDKAPSFFLFRFWVKEVVDPFFWGFSAPKFVDLGSSFQQTFPIQEKNGEKIGAKKMLFFLHVGGIFFPV